MIYSVLPLILFPRRLLIVRVFLCVYLCSSVAHSLLAQSSDRISRQPDSEAVCQLRRALAETYPSSAQRDRAIKQCLTELRSLADLQRAATLTEWSALSTDDEAAAIDRSNHAIAIERFIRAVRGILQKGEPASAASTMEMLGRMAALARTNDEPLTLVGSFAPDLADLVIKGPPCLRGLAAHTLAQTGPPVFVAVPALSELLRADDVELRRAAADSFALLIQNALQAMGETGPVLRPAPRSGLVLVASTVVPAAHAGLQDARPEVRRRCLHTIRLACAALGRLMEEPPQSEDSSPRRSLEAEYAELRPLLQALRDQGPILERFLHDEDPESRILTHKTLEELGFARARWLRRCATRREGADEKLLSEMLHEAVPQLAEALAHPDVRVRRSALDVLEMSGPLALPALPALTRALRDPDRFVRWSAVRTVGKLGPSAAPQTLSSLTQLLNDPDEGLRKAAADALQLLREPSSQFSHR
ncbi:MAG TPA: HEAT repeat domain-containing protein [Gemmataceae bacterium]|nr:HEAT repeat domain-containing protein [Gemmataceae bacterium]